MTQHTISCLFLSLFLPLLFTVHTLNLEKSESQQPNDSNLVWVCSFPLDDT